MKALVKYCVILTSMLWVYFAVPNELLANDYIKSVKISDKGGRSYLTVYGAYPYRSERFLELAVDVNGNGQFDRGDYYAVATVRTEFFETFDVRGLQGRRFQITLWGAKRSAGDSWVALMERDGDGAVRPGYGVAMRSDSFQGTIR